MAGNAFGIMTAGVDAAAVAFHGRSLMDRVQRRIADEDLDEQPVGACSIESTGNPASPFVAPAPTIRMPGPIDGTDGVSRAAWASLLAISRHDAAVRRTGAAEVVTVAFPALGTGFGNAGFSEAARQMVAAYAHYLSPPHRLDWDTAVERHRAGSFDRGGKVAG